MKPLLIQFTGSQGTGKTTLVDAFLRKYEGQKIGEITRIFKAENLISGSDVYASYIDQMMLNTELLYQYFDKIGKAEKDSLIIAERSPICCWGYFENLQTPMTMKVIQYIEIFLRKFIESLENRNDIDVLTIYVPLHSSIPFKEDGFRLEESRKDVDTSIFEFFDTEVKGNKFCLNEALLENRIEELENKIELFRPGFLKKLER